MTEAPVPLAEQPTPGWYWVRRIFTNPHFAGKLGAWRADYLDDDGRWYPGWTDRDKFEIGPRIPNPETLQQHERAMAAVVEAARKVPRPHGEHVAEWNALWAALRDLAALDAASAAGDEG